MKTKTNMSKISSIEKGDSFEEKVFNIIRDLLINDEFFVSGKKSKIFWKKKYQSVKTNSEVEVDISIETYLNGAEKYSLLTVIECKNYKGRIPVNDIRELSSILNEIGEHNTKGILISNSAFQKGTLEFAKRTQIGLGRINFTNEIDWVNHRLDKKVKVPDLSETNLELSADKIKKSNFVAVNNNIRFNTLPDLLINVGVLDRYSNLTKYINIPFKTKENIKKAIDNIFDGSFYKNEELNIEKACTKLTETFGVEFIFDEELPNHILGKIEFNPLKIFVTKSLKTDIYRWRFTIAHEFGHLILHKQLLNKYIDKKVDKDDALSFIQSNNFTNNKRLEIQANIFASNALLPNNSLTEKVKEYFEKERIHKGYLFFDNQPINQRLVLSFLSELQRDFKVSKYVAKYRLIELGLLEDETDISISNIKRKRRKPSV